MANLRPETTLGVHCEVDTRTSNDAEALNVIREFFNENHLSKQVNYENLNPNSSNHGLEPEGPSNNLVTFDSGHGHMGESAIGSSNYQVLNIDVPDTNDLYMQIRHGFSNSEMPLNLDELISRVLEMVLDDASLSIPSISNTSMNMPLFPPADGTNDGMITNQIPSGNEFQNVELHTTMQNDGLKFINRMVEECHDYDTSGICYKNPAVNKNIITRSKSLNETETEKIIDINQWPKMDVRISGNGQCSQYIPMEDTFESMTLNSTTTEFETGGPSMVSYIPKHESFFYDWSIKDRARLDTTDGVMLGNNCPIAPTVWKIGLNDATLVIGHKEYPLMPLSLEKKSDCFEDSPSDYVHALPGTSFSQPNEFKKPECWKRSQHIGDTEPPAVGDIRAIRFICSVCHKAFEYTFKLAKHMDIHKNIKPYKCNVCGKSFSKKAYLKGHLLIHSGIKPFKCKICKKPFRHMTTMKRHFFTHTEDKPYACQTCGKKFIRKYGMEKHVLNHLGLQNS